MNFAWPQLFWLLAVPVALLAWDLFHRQRSAASTHPKILRAEAGHHHLALIGSVPSRPGKTRWLLGLGLIFAVVALARPQWGRLEEPVFDQSREILIAVDLSRSMLATDVKPSRLERAKLLIRSLLEKLEGERVGLVVFSGTAFLQSPLSADYEILREFLPALGPDYLPEGGTNFRALLETSLTAFGSATAADRFLIVLSDGEATDDDWKALMSDLKKKDIRIITLGVGTAAGAMIPDGSGAFVKDERGAVVLSKLDDSALRELARDTNGDYRDASSWLDLAGVLQATVEAGRKGEFLEKNTVRLVERYQWALTPALVFLLLSLWREFPVRPRPRDLKLAVAETGKIAALAAILLVGGLGLPLPVIAAPAAVPPPETAPEPTVLGKIVSRLAGQPSRTGRDWAELARETVTWGEKLQSEKQPVTEGPVRDALLAVDLGSTLDAKTADWPTLRRELEALLQKPESQEQPDQPQDQSEKQDQDQQSQQNQDSSPSEQNQQQQQDQSSPSEQSPSESQQKNDPAPGDPKQDSAFGDMQQKAEPPPPPPSSETQKVGGAPEKKEPDQAATDPALTMPLQKLEQLRNQDSPARLFQMMEGEKKPAPAKKGKDW